MEYDFNDYGDDEPPVEDKPTSAFACHALQLIEAGYSPLPITPGTKEPTHVSEWSTACEQQMPEQMLARYLGKDCYGLGGACGYGGPILKDDRGKILGCGTGGLIAVDIDTEDEAIMAAVRSVLPASVVAKRGKKGRTDLYRAVGEIKNRKLKAGGSPIVEILSGGSQTVLPPTIHPDIGQPYTWLTERALWDVTPDELPEITPEHIERLAAALEPWTGKAKPKAADQIDAAGRIDWIARFVPPGLSDRPDLRRYTAKAAADIQGRCGDLAKQPEPGRNEALFDAACYLGKWVHHSLVTRAELTGQLLAACRANGVLDADGEDQCMATIENGLTKAEGDPLPELKDRERPQPANDDRPPDAPQPGTIDADAIVGDIDAHELLQNPAPERKWLVSGCQSASKLDPSGAMAVRCLARSCGA
jgi:hypothetical protein